MERHTLRCLPRDPPPRLRCMPCRRHAAPAPLQRTHTPCPSLPSPPQGTLTPFSTDFLLATPVVTDADGLFPNDAVSPGIIAFPPTCTDSLTATRVTYWSVAPVAPGVSLKLSPAAALTEAHRRLTCARGAGCKAVDDAAVFDGVYALFGFPTFKGVDFRSWDGIVMGTEVGRG